MPCCGGKKGGKPISRLQFAVGRVIFFGIRVTLAAGLGLAARVSPRFAPIARFWGLLSADWERAIVRREGIVFHGDGHDAACPLAPPSHRDATGGDAAFGSDWGDDTLLPEALASDELAVTAAAREHARGA
ncbi:MAG: hypothetical protein IPK07_12615 [Deltaproteobacteria bacterium]|nr:hypothetical protein [Deltaproteobacteria bacterium]